MAAKWLVRAPPAFRAALDEEKAADEKLSSLAEGGINQEALMRRTLMKKTSRKRTQWGSLEDDDLLEMVHAGLIPIVIVDDYLARFWAQVLPRLQVHYDVALRTGGEIAVVFRKNSLKLIAAAAAFNKRWGQRGRHARPFSSHFAGLQAPAPTRVENRPVW